MKRIKKIPLIFRILAAMALGVLFGQFLPVGACRLFATFNSIFSQFLGFLIPLIILGFVAPAIAETGRKAGKILLITAGISYAFTILAGLFSYATGSTVFPHLITPGELTHVDAVSGPEPFFTVEMPPLFGVMTALIAAFVLGIGMASIDSTRLRGAMNEFRSIVEITIAKVIIPLLPLYIFGVFLSMTIGGQVFVVLGAFVKIIAVLFAAHIVVLLVQYGIAGILAKKNPLKLLATMLPAYFTALGTQSSAATIPVTLRQSLKTGVTEDVAGFVVPLCATIHMSGSILKLVGCSLAIMIMNGMAFDFSLFAGFIAMLGVTIIAAPGVPGGAVMASLGLMASMLGFTAADQALIIALYIAMDSFGTACNVTGDGSIALIINRIFRKREELDMDLAA